MPEIVTNSPWDSKPQPEPTVPSGNEFTQLAFIVEGIPIAQPRQRQAGRANYTPSKHAVNRFKLNCQNELNRVWNSSPVSGPLRMDVLFVFPRRKSSPPGRSRHVVVPDRDNVMKSLQDALEGLLYLNDAQVCAGFVEKWVANEEEKPHTEVLVTSL